MPSIPVFQVDLDTHPSKRWSKVIHTYKHHIKAIWDDNEKLFQKSVPRVWLQCLYKYIDHMARKGYIYHEQELRAIAKEAEVPFGGLVMMQIFYELSACCTAMVLDHKTLGPVHFRTLDWQATQLSNLTIEVHFCRNNKLVYTALTWAGFVGVFTAMKPGCASVSLNFRRTNRSFFGNVWRLWMGHWPASYAIRDALERFTDYNTIVEKLRTTPLVAPCYLMVSGACHQEAIVLARDHDKTVWEKEGKCLIQTNVDDVKSCRPEHDILFSTKRHETALKLAHSILKGVHRASDINQHLLHRFLVHPIRNDTTVFACVMNAKHGRSMSTLVTNRDDSVTKCTG